MAFLYKQYKYEWHKIKMVNRERCFGFTTEGVHFNTRRVEELKPGDLIYGCRSDSNKRGPSLGSNWQTVEEHERDKTAHTEWARMAALEEELQRKREELNVLVQNVFPHIGVKYYVSHRNRGLELFYAVKGKNFKYYYVRDLKDLSDDSVLEEAKSYAEEVALAYAENEKRHEELNEVRAEYEAALSEVLGREVKIPSKYTYDRFAESPRQNQMFLVTDQEEKALLEKSGICYVYGQSGEEEWRVNPSREWGHRLTLEKGSGGLDATHAASMFGSRLNVDYSE
jgi:hypothetical protein